MIVNIEKYKQGIEVFEARFNLKIAEDHRATLLNLVELYNIGKLHFAFLGLPLNRSENSYAVHLADVPYELMRYDLFNEGSDTYTNPFEIADEVIKYSGHKGAFPIARGDYGDGYDLLYFMQRTNGQLERIVSLMREGSKMGFLAINLRPLVRGALLLKDVKEVEQTLGYTIDPIFYAEDFKYSKNKEEENLAKQIPSANKKILDYYRRISVGFQYPALYGDNIWNKTKPMGKPDMSEDVIAEIGVDFKHFQQINFAEFDDTKDSLFPAEGLMNIFLHRDVVKREDAGRLNKESFKIHFQASPKEGERAYGDTIYLLQSKSLYPSYDSKIWEEEEVSFSREEKNYVYERNDAVLTDKLKEQAAFFFGGIPPLMDSSGMDWLAVQMWGKVGDKEEDFLHISSFLLPDNERDQLWRVCVGIRKSDLVETQFEKVKAFVFKVY